MIAGIGQFEFCGPGGAADLALVGLMVAADQHGDRLAVGQVDQRLDELLRLAAEKLAHLLDGAGAGVATFVQRLQRRCCGGTQVAAPISAFSWLAA